MQFAKPLLAAFALGGRVALPAHAELDVASRTQLIYPWPDALYIDIHAYPNKAR
jgi:hypothetical protein